MIEMRGSWRDVTPVGMALARLMPVFLLGVTPPVIALHPVKENGHFSRFGLSSVHPLGDTGFSSSKVKAQQPRASKKRFAAFLIPPQAALGHGTRFSAGRAGLSERRVPVP